MSRPPCPQISTTGECCRSTASGNSAARDWSRICPPCLDSLGRRNARTKVERSVVAEADADSGTLTGTEGKYLKLGKRKADAVWGVAALVDDDDCEGRKEELVTRILLKGYSSNCQWDVATQMMIKYDLRRHIFPRARAGASILGPSHPSSGPDRPLLCDSSSLVVRCR